MALYCSFCKSYKTVIIPSYALVKYIHKNIENRSVILEVDTLDDFTSQLIQKQSSKWENIQAKSKRHQKHVFSVKHSSDEPLVLWDKAIEERNTKTILELLDFCVEIDKPPPKSKINSVLQILAENGKSLAILQLKTLYEKHLPDVLKIHTNFDLYLAEAFWNQGDMRKSLNLFQEVYATSKSFKTQINETLKCLFLNTIRNHSEAVLLMVIKFCKQLHDKHEDIFLLSVVWQICFLSEWFSDQEVAFDLIEENGELRKIVLLRMPFIVTVALNSHQIDVVYRLLEFLLRHNLQTECSSVLHHLFDYKSKCKFV